MKIAAWLGCKDEAELIGHTIAHLRGIGVDHIYAVDVKSTDGTLDILQAEAGRGDLEVLTIDVEADGPDVEHRVAEEVMSRAKARGMDWLLFCDADEFWLPRGGHLRDMAGLAGADVIKATRYNVMLTDDGPALRLPVTPDSLDDLLVHCPPPAGKGGWRRVLAEDPAMAWIRVVPNPKLMIRLDGVAAVQAGHHAVQAEDDRPEPVTVTARDTVIAHVPFSTVERFRLKVRNIIELHEATGQPWPDGQAWHWRMFRDGAAEAGVEAEFARNITPPDQQDALRADGLLRSIDEILAGWAAEDAEADSGDQTR